MAQITLNDIQIRPAIAGDLNFIFDSFRKSMLSDSKIGKTCRISIFNKEFNKVIDYILSTSKIAIACAKEDVNVILGYIIYTYDCLHFVFIKDGFRNSRLGSILFAYAFGPGDRIIECSCLTEYGRKLLKKKPNILIDHNPFILFHKGAINGERKSAG